MNKFEYSKIYAIICKTTNAIYIGSTYTNLKVRLCKHNTDLKGYLGINKKYRNYRSSFEVLFNNNYDIILIEDYPCNSKRELEERESLYIKKYRSENINIVNSRLPVKCDDNNYSSLSSCPSLM